MGNHQQASGTRILLILPDAGIHRMKLGSLSISFREAPLTLISLAALVPHDLNASIRLVDESVDKIPFDESFDLVGISCLTGTALRAYEIADRMRTTGCVVVLGGIHVTLRPEEASAHADAIVQGFAEEDWPQLLRDFVDGGLKDVYRGGATQLAGLPHPRRDLQKKYAYMMPNTVQATRGCRRNCEFCTVPAIPFGWQTRPVHEVVDEISRLPGRRFVFNDVNLVEDREYARELFSALIGLKKKWGALATVDLALDEELLELMARSGCVYLLLGFESLKSDGLKGMGKQFNLKVDYGEAVSRLHANGILVQGCFILGLDSDNRDVFSHVVQAVHDLRIDIPRFAIFTPYPETGAFKRLKREGRILHEYWPHYDTQHVVFQPARMSPDELDDGFKWTYRKAFSLASIARRGLKARGFPIPLLGNIAYLRYARRLQVSKERIYYTNAIKDCTCPT
jgi:radical SAM superfamily enzyme YgiQ (UPF0313 family)